MTNPFSKTTAFIILVLLPLSLQAQPAPEEVAFKFSSLRSDPYCYVGSSLIEYNKLKTWDQEPGWDMVFIIDTFTIVSSRIEGYKAYVDVNYSILGVYSGDQWFPQDTSVITQYMLVNTVEGWKIALPCENPRVSIFHFIKDSDKQMKQFKESMESYEAGTAAYEGYRKMYENRDKAFFELKKIALTLRKKD